MRLDHDDDIIKTFCILMNKYSVCQIHVSYYVQCNVAINCIKSPTPWLAGCESPPMATK